MISVLSLELLSVAEFGDCLGDNAYIKNQIASSIYYLSYGWYPALNLEPGVA